MKYRLFFYQFIHLFVLCSCSNHKQTELITVLKHQTIYLGEDFIGYGGFITYYQGVVVGMDLSPSAQPFFCITPNGSSQTLFRFGNKGQGPNDFLRPSSIQYIDNLTIGAFDMMSRTYNEFIIPNEHEELKVDKKIEFQMPLTRVIKTASNKYIGLSIEEEMFLLADSTGMSVKTFFEYPYKDADERQFASRSHAYQGILSTNPSKNKFVYSSFQGDIIHFYRIVNDNIKLIAKIENEYPLYRKRDDDYEGVAFHQNVKIGYIATYATDKFVYALYSGIKINEIKSVNFEGVMLHVFDWNGVLVKKYELDVPCSYLCVSDDDSKIWAVASNPDIILVSFDLENKQDNGIHAMLDMPDLEKKQSINRNAINYIIEVAKDGIQDDETQKTQDSIKSQIMNGNDMNLDNADVKIDTIADNLIKIQFNLR